MILLRILWATHTLMGALHILFFSILFGVKMKRKLMFSITTEISY